MMRWLLLLFVLASAPAIGADVEPLRSNPFSRPPSVVLPGAVGLPAGDDEAPSVDLRATMVGSGGSLANVGGRILRPGQRLEDLKLIKVFEDRAVFTYRGERLTVFVRPQPTESENED